MQRIALLIVSSHTATLGEHTDYHAVTRTVTVPMLAALNIQSVVLDDIKDARRVFKQAPMTVKGQFIPVCISLLRHVLWEDE
jgi:hypothetical protein